MIGLRTYKDDTGRTLFVKLGLLWLDFRTFHRLPGGDIVTQEMYNNYYRGMNSKKVPMLFTVVDWRKTWKTSRGFIYGLATGALLVWLW